jgi:hypothetical protein
MTDSSSSIYPTGVDGERQKAQFNSSYPLPVQYILRAASVGSMAILVVVLVTLAIHPALGLKLVWSLIIPAAPLIFFLMPNVWTNLCPFAIIQSIPRRMNYSRKKELTEKQTRWLRMLGWGLLFVLVPARHFLYNHDASALLLTTLVLAAVVLFFGYNYKGLSGWCMGVCPIRPVEMMYGQFTPERCRPEVCTVCEQCNVNCSRNNVRKREVLERNNTGFKYFIFSFPGFVLGYYLTGPDMNLASLYGVIYGLSLVSLALIYLIDRRWPSVKIMNHSIILALIDDGRA